MGILDFLSLYRTFTPAVLATSCFFPSSKTHLSHTPLTPTANLTPPLKTCLSKQELLSTFSDHELNFHK